MCPEDLFGQAFIDFHQGKRYRLELERDDGYVDEQDLSVYFRDFEDFPEVERKALRHAKGRILDIGVGAAGSPCTCSAEESKSSGLTSRTKPWR